MKYSLGGLALFLSCFPGFALSANQLDLSQYRINFPPLIGEGQGGVINASSSVDPLPDVDLSHAFTVVSADRLPSCPESVIPLSYNAPLFYSPLKKGEKILVWDDRPSDFTTLWTASMNIREPERPLLLCPALFAVGLKNLPSPPYSPSPHGRGGRGVRAFVFP